MWHYKSNDLTFNGNDEYILNQTGEQFFLLNELKKCCLFSRDGVFSAFSNAGLHVDIQLEIGRMTSFDLSTYLPNEYLAHQLTIIAHPLVSGVAGNMARGEWVFPHIQYNDNKRINFTASAPHDCPTDFRPTIGCPIYLAFETSDNAVQLLHKSLIELSQNRPNFAAILLYASLESASTILSGIDYGKISSRLHKLSERIKPADPEMSRKLNRLKKRIEKTIVKTRGDFAHKGRNVDAHEILMSYETALEFFWYYSKMKEMLK